MATELAKAYIQILPTTKGIKSNLEKEMNDAGASAGKSAGGKIGSMIKGAIAAAGIGKVIKDAVLEGADLEQNLGGTEAVFGKFAQTIQDQAVTAYKNMGLSASDYMATANKMGSLFQGSGLEQQKALDLTTQAMQRAADVASVMGLDLSSAMESVAGAAKGNFTMMDNLGVAMNATTIEAYALEKGINFEWKTASNAEKSEVAMQMFFDRTQQYAGNFARESAETLSGSLDATKSAFKNVLGNLALGNDISPSLNALSETVGFFISDNLLPMITNTVSALPSAITTVIGEAAPALITSLAELTQQLPRIVSAFMRAGFDIANSLIGGITESIPLLLPELVKTLMWIPDTIIDGIQSLIPVIIAAVTTLISEIPNCMDAVFENISDIIKTLFYGLTDIGPEIIIDLLQALSQMIPAVISAMQEYIPWVAEVIIEALQDNLPQIIDSVMLIADEIPNVIDSICNGLISLLPVIIETGITLFSGLVDVLPTVITKVIVILPSLIESICSSLMSFIPQLIDAGITLFTAVINELPTIINTIVLALPQIIDGIVGALLGMLPQIIDCGVQLLVSLVQALPDITYAIVSVLPVLIASIISTLVGLIPELIVCGIDLFTSLISALPEIIISIVAVLPQIISSIIQALLDQLPLLIQCGIDLFISLIGALPDIIVALVSAMPKIITSVIKALLDNIPLIVSSGIKLLTSLIKNMPEIIKTIVKALPQIITSIVESFKEGIGKIKEVGGNLVEGLWNGLKDKVGWILEKIKSFGADVLNGIKDIFGIHSPSKATEWMGEMLDEGLGRGIDKNTKPVRKAIDNITRMTTGTLESSLSINTALGISSTPSSADNDKIDMLIVIMRDFEKTLKNMRVVLDSGAVVGGISSKIDDKLGENNILATRGVSYLGLSADKINLFDSYPVYNPYIGFDDTLEVIKKTTDIFSPFTPNFTLGSKNVPLSDIIAKSKDKANAVEKQIDGIKTQANNQFNAVYSFVSTSATEIQQNTDSLFAQVTENTVSKSVYEEFSETVRNILQMDANGTSMIFQTITEELSRIDSEGQSRYSEILKYIRFENGNIILGEIGNEITLTLENDILAFRQNGTVVAYFAHNRFRVVDGEFIKSLQIGKFAFIPRKNGNLSFKKVGD